MRFYALFQNLRKVCANITHLYMPTWYRATEFGSDVTIKLGSGKVLQGSTTPRWGLAGIGHNTDNFGGARAGLFRCVEAIAAVL